ncbi:DoxX family protein [Aporhodopirellula aestuarii]|uniref:DoxX family protein n=1 Tax=Aporhodopirellula aestuarii TaxID=2950107 RepID=A0ABT0TXW0_9BACT|nr:MauE/DoxX family redox-associated membrane protein [Aporhodopirellula aestuarii]MCM2369424.1 hypothetical protein [Aporhodopirellula aestuarii]
MNTTARKNSLWMLGVLFVVAGINHFVSPEVYRRIMPPYLPAHLMLIYVSGVFEVLGGVGLLVPSLRRTAGWGLIALLIAVFPANVHMAMNVEQFPAFPLAAIYARLPLQFLLIAWVYWAAIRTSQRE